MKSFECLLLTYTYCTGFSCSVDVTSIYFEFVLYDCTFYSLSFSSFNNYYILWFYFSLFALIWSINSSIFKDSDVSRRTLSLFWIYYNLYYSELLYEYIKFYWCNFSWKLSFFTFFYKEGLLILFSSFYFWL